MKEHKLRQLICNTLSAAGLLLLTAVTANAQNSSNYRIVDPWYAPDAVQRSVVPPDQLELAPSLGTRLPGEFEPHEALLLAARDLTTSFPDLFIEIVEGARSRIQIVSLVQNRAERELVERLVAQNGLPQESVHCFEVAHDTMWLRDYGPVFVTGRQQPRAIVDGDYLQHGRTNDDQVPASLSIPFRSHVFHAPIELEGGNLLSNGRGLIVTTTAMLELNQARGVDEEEIRRRLRQYFGATQVVFLDRLDGEPTGHADMFATFTSPDTIVVGSYDPIVDPVNSEILERNAAILSGIVTSTGKPLNVYRVPMPPRTGDIWRTYTNGIYANGVLLLPVYPHVDPVGERQTYEIFHRLLPGWKVVGIDATEVIQFGGALHCISQQVPVDEQQLYGAAMINTAPANHAPKFHQVQRRL
jgi:agmatine/peptidylarginine deiminase